MTDLSPEEERRLRDAIAALPESVEPAEDLWPEIRARIDATRVVAMPGAAGQSPRRSPRRLTLSAGHLATAASLLIAATAALTWYALRGGSSSTGAGNPSATATVGIDAPSLATFVAYENTAAELSEALERRAALLEPRTREVLARSLRTIDVAIEEARAALAADPASATMRTFVETAYRQKVDFLRRANDLAALRGT